MSTDGTESDVLKSFAYAADRIRFDTPTKTSTKRPALSDGWSVLLDAALCVVSGALFTLGLLVSGMTDSHRVRGFLDVTGQWDPRLALVMGGAIAVTLPAFAYVHSTVGGVNRQPVTRELVIGAVIFGIGWGMSGICPGPAVLQLTTGHIAPIVFIVGMIVGMILYSNTLTATAAPPALIKNASILTGR